MTVPELVWCLPDLVETGHRGDTASPDEGSGSLDLQVDLPDDVASALRQRARAGARA